MHNSNSQVEASFIHNADVLRGTAHQPPPDEGQVLAPSEHLPQPVEGRIVIT